MTKVTLIDKSYHSTIDWDFLKASDWTPWTTWLLTTYLAVSPPTCLYFHPGNTVEDKYFLSNLPQAQDIKEGMLITWHCRQLGGLGGTFAYIGVTGIGSTGISVSLPSINLVMRRNRLVWWSDTNPAGQPITRTRLDWWIDEEWAEGVVFDHPPLSGPVNRVGCGARGQSISAQKYFDDTEIWKAC